MFTSQTLLFVLAFAGSTFSAAAQTAAEPQFKISCEEGSWSRNNGENKRFCETRDLTMSAPTGQPLTIDGGGNGGITVHGWSGSTVRIRAKVQSWANTEAEAQSRVKGVTISTTNNTLRASAADKEEHFSVSYDDKYIGKIREMAEREGIDLAQSFAYSDSESDLPMLRLVGNPVTVNPDAELTRIARAEGWRIITFDRLRRRVRIAAAAGAVGALGLAGGWVAGRAPTLWAGWGRRSTRLSLR